VLTVVKVGGGIGDDALPGVCAALGELGKRHRLLVVPGGAGFADAVRDADRRFGLHCHTSHRMAILAMEQYGWLLSDLIPGVPVLLPAGLPLDELPASWAVTSDSIAAWVAHRVGAERLVLVKAADRRGVDGYFPTAIEGARFETVVVTPEELLDPLLPWPHG
jgi:aspartokinase-like uncharacterized kinase